MKRFPQHTIYVNYQTTTNLYLPTIYSKREASILYSCKILKQEMKAVSSIISLNLDMHPLTKLQHS